VEEPQRLAPRMIARTLWRTTTMKARDIMTPDPEVVTPEEPISRAARIMRDYDVGIVPASATARAAI